MFHLNKRSASSPETSSERPEVIQTQPRPVSAPIEGNLEELKRVVQARLVEEIDLSRFQSASNTPQAYELLRRLLSETAQQRDELLPRAKFDQLLEELLHEILGLGPLEPLLSDSQVTEIMVNSPQQVYVERAGRLELTDARFENDEHLARIIDRIVGRVGRHIDEANPMCDARLPDGSRINAILPPLALNGPCLTVRRFSKQPLTIANLIDKGSLTDDMALFLRRCVEAKFNILVSGGTGTGKTTILNVLSSFIPTGERLITIEDAAELQLQQPHVIRLETRQANTEGLGAVGQADLLRNTLRMRPDRIILGEVRGAEALSMLQAMNTGHEGSLTTVHANTCRDALARLETMVLMAGLDLPHRAIREQIASAIDIVIQIERACDGTRRVTQISEMCGMEGEIYLLQDLFKYVLDGRGTRGYHSPTGIVPRCQSRLEALGLSVPTKTFLKAS